MAARLLAPSQNPLLGLGEPPSRGRLGRAIPTAGTTAASLVLAPLGPLTLAA